MKKELKNLTIVLCYYREENVTGPVCVFWDLEAHAWSDAGCRLLSTNQTHSSCACDHLTNFALLMRRDDGGLGGSGINIRIDIVAGVVAAVVAIGILVALIKVSYSKMNGCCVWIDCESNTFFGYYSKIHFYT